MKVLYIVDGGINIRIEYHMNLLDELRIHKAENIDSGKPISITNKQDSDHIGYYIWRVLKEHIKGLKHAKVNARNSR